MLCSIIGSENNAGCHMAKLLPKLNYSKFYTAMRYVAAEPTRTHTVVILEYVNSTYDTVIAEIERLPGTTTPIDVFLERPEVISALRKLFAKDSDTAIYTRRKIDHQTGELTKYKQLVVKIRPPLPSPILNPEDEYDDGVYLAPLDL